MNHTRLVRLSIATADSSANSTPTLEVPSGSSLVVGGVAAFTGAESHSGNMAFTGSAAFGASGFSISGIRKSTVSVALGTVAFDSVTTSVSIANIEVGDPVIAIVPASTWSGAYRDISLSGLASAQSTVLIGAVNSTLTGINTSAMNMDVFWIDLA